MAYGWRLGLAVGLLQGVLTAITELLELPNPILVANGLAFVLGAPIAWWIMKAILGLSFSDFRLALLPTENQ